jgi:Fis family transcriptional regulator
VTLDSTLHATSETSRFTVSATRTPEPLRDAVMDALTHYFDQLDGTPPNDLYQLVLQQVEQPLFESVMHYTGGNQSRAATLLGISRSTLRKKLAQYEIE